MTHSALLKEKPLALIVDDEISLRISMCAALEKEGFEVLEAENGHEALSLFQSRRPDLVLLDVLMPELDGFETCTAIRNLPGGQYAQILMVTGLDDSESTERAFEVGANDFVSKPLNWTMLGHRAKYMLRAGQVLQALNKSERRLAKTQELAKLGNWECFIKSDLFHCSPEACRLLGLSDEREISYKDFLAPVIAEEYDRVKQEIDTAIKANTTFSVTYRVILPDGTLRYILNRGEILYNSAGAAEKVLGAVQDVTLLKRAEEKIRMLAFYDSLTGLANRMLFMDRLDQEILSAKRHKKTFALLFLDLDKFKEVNDSYGHHIGDLLLKNVAETFSRCVRGIDSITQNIGDISDTLIARLGGDEFIILITDVGEPENAAIVARRILYEMQNAYALEGYEVTVSTSIGISVFPADGDDAEILLKHADSALYHAKGLGKNNYQFYKESEVS